MLFSGSGRFSAGIDINMLDSDVDFTSDRQVVLSSMAQLMEQGPKPSVAAVEGVCLGAGLELALACTARVAARTALLGLPEVRLGLIPGLGGTQRLPRVIPLPEAINLITTGVVVSASRAQELGFVDEICGNEHDVLPIAIDLALRISQGLAEGISLASIVCCEGYGSPLKTTETPFQTSKINLSTLISTQERHRDRLLRSLGGTGSLRRRNSSISLQQPNLGCCRNGWVPLVRSWRLMRLRRGCCKAQRLV